MIRILIKYLIYLLFSSHKKGHGIHSPFVFTFIRKVLVGEDSKTDPMLRAWCRQVRKWKLPEKGIRPGAGTRAWMPVFSGRAGSIGISCKFGEMLFRLARFCQPVQVFELGTGTGLATGFLSKAVPGATIISIDADPERIKFAADSLSPLNLGNTRLICQEFDDFLACPGNISTPFLVFIDGNHRFGPTMKYFDFFASKAKSGTVIVLDDIRWSYEMEKAWAAIKQDQRVVVTIDLFFMGVVFFSEGIPRQDFVVKF